MTNKMVCMGGVALTIGVFSSLIAGCTSAPNTNSTGVQGLTAQQMQIKKIQEDPSLTQKQKAEQTVQIVKQSPKPPVAP